MSNCGARPDFLAVRHQVDEGILKPRGIWKDKKGRNHERLLKLQDSHHSKGFALRRLRHRNLEFGGVAAITKTDIFVLVSEFTTRSADLKLFLATEVGSYHLMTIQIRIP